MQEGDVTLFSAKNKFFASAVVTYKVHSPAVAAQLWKPDKKLGQLFEYVYFLDELRELAIPYATFNNLLEYKPKNVVRGFHVLDAAQSEILFDTFELASDTYIEPITQTVYEDLQNKKALQSKLNALEKTDGVRSAKYRLEQGHLKKYLFGYHTIATCGICQQEFPVGTLVAAHIKPRAKCEPEERTDLHVVMPMCKFGCDELFEKGYISVDAGKVIDLAKQPNTAAVRAKLKEVVGKACTYATPERISYFVWHFNTHRKKSL